MPGAGALRGGAFKPRTSPYSFQGHGEKALELLVELVPEIVPPRACGPEVRGQLRAVLGPPRVLQADIWYWDIAALP